MKLFSEFIIATVERPDGTTFEQELEVEGNVKKTLSKYQNECLGPKWKWYYDKKTKTKKLYIPSNAYIIVSWRWSHKVEFNKGLS